MIYTDDLTQMTLHRRPYTDDPAADTVLYTINFQERSAVDV